MATSATKTDIIISIRPPHLDHIVERKKTREFRKYLLPESIKRFWIYEPSPVSAIKYIAEISVGKLPGTLIENGSVHDDDVPKGIISSGKYAYEILTLEALDEPITLSELKRQDWLRGAPQKYCYVKESMTHALVDMETTTVFTHPILPANDTPDLEVEHRAQTNQVVSPRRV